MQFKGELLCGEKKCEKHPKNKKKFFGREILKLRGDISPLKALRKITAIKVFRCNLIYKESMYVMYKKIKGGKGSGL